jgi:hypothetical protein
MAERRRPSSARRRAAPPAANPDVDLDEAEGASGSSANAEVARLFSEIGDILEIKGEPPYRYNAYRTASRSVGSARERLEALFEEGRLRELNGVGSALEARGLGGGQVAVGQWRPPRPRMRP